MVMARQKEIELKSFSFIFGLKSYFLSAQPSIRSIDRINEGGFARVCSSENQNLTAIGICVIKLIIIIFEAQNMISDRHMIVLLDQF